MRWHVRRKEQLESSDPTPPSHPLPSETVEDSPYGRLAGVGQDVRIERGDNPRPAEGWSWYLTEHEVAYVVEYNVRPMRDETWAGDSASDARLDLEAEGVRAAAKATPRIKSSTSTHPRRWIAVAIAIFVAAGVMFAVTAFNLATTDALKVSTHSVDKTWQQ